MQFSKECVESAVKHCTANLQQLMSALCRPAHGLAFTHSLVYQVTDPRFGQLFGPTVFNGSNHSYFSVKIFHK
jgi:hypothetical protein